MDSSNPPRVQAERLRLQFTLIARAMMELETLDELDVADALLVAAADFYGRDRGPDLTTDWLRRWADCIDNIWRPASPEAQ